MTCLAWVAINNGPWNNDATANPATGANGLNLTPTDGNLLFPTVGGSVFGAGGAQTCNFGASSFAFAVPAGFTAGWPASGGGWTTLNPATIGGPGLGTLSNGNLTFTGGLSGGWVQALDGYQNTANLKLYFEVHYDSLAAINDFFGAGVGRAFPGIDYSTFYSHNGGYNATTDQNGGVVCWSQHPLSPDFQTNLGALTTVIATGSAAGGFGPYQTGAVLRFAVQLGAPAPPGRQFTVADLWFAPTDGFVDLSASDNRRKFLGVDGSAQFLGADGSLPFGSAPPVFLSLPNGEPANVWAQNFGNGGTFAIAGGSLAPDGGPPCSTSMVISPPTPAERDADAPQIMLDYSKDGGITWAPLQVFRSMGDVGQYIKRLRWLNLGVSRTWIFRLQCTDPVRRYIIGAYIDSYKGLG